MRKTLSGIYEFLMENKSLLLFSILGIASFIISKQPMSFLLSEIVARFGRNTFLVLSLIIPIVTGMGLNFGIVVGAMAGQIAIMIVANYQIPGLGGLLLATAIATPIAMLLGSLTGMLLNKMKGQEMIGGMILGYFSNGLYQLVFLFLCGTIIPVNNPAMLITGGVGIKNTVDLKFTIKNTLDGIVKLSLLNTIEIAFLLITIFCIARVVYAIFIKKADGSVVSKLKQQKRPIALFVAFLILYVLTYIPYMFNLLANVYVPVITYCLIGLLCLFNTLLMKTRLGQSMRTVGQSRSVANAAGINVDKIRIIAIIFSTVLASWGQIILLQNLGTLQTYTSHEQIGMFAIASILVGGASVQKATNKQALLGVLLFHVLFTLSPIAGKQLFDDPQLGEYFRVFIAYGVIGVSLGLHAWQSVAAAKKKANNS